MSRTTTRTPAEAPAGELARAADTQTAAASTVADVDEEALARASEMLGTDSPRDTVNEALREVVRRRQVGAYINLMKRMADEAARANTVDDSRTDAW